MVVSRSALVVVVAAGEFGAEVEEAPWAREIEIRDPDGNRLRVATPKDWATGAPPRPTRSVADPR